MALKFFDGFELWDDPLKTGQKEIVQDPCENYQHNYAKVVLNPTRTGNRSFQIRHTGTGSFYESSGRSFIKTYIDTTSNKMILGFGFRWNTEDGYTHTKIHLGYFLKISDQNNTKNITLNLTPDNRIQAKYNGTSIGTSPIIMTPNTQYYIQLKYVASENGFFELLGDNQQWILVQNQNLSNASNVLNSVVFGCDSVFVYYYTSDIWIDDVWILDGDPPLNFYLGDCRIYPMPIDHTGSDFDFTTVGTNNPIQAVTKFNLDGTNANTYIYGKDMTDTALFNFDVVDTSYIVGGVSILNVVQRGPESVGFIRYQTIQKYGSNEAIIGERNVFANPSYHLYMLTTNPVTNQPQMLEEVDQSEFGIRISKID